MVSCKLPWTRGKVERCYQADTNPFNEKEESVNTIIGIDDKKNRETWKHNSNKAISLHLLLWGISWVLMIT